MDTSKDHVVCSILFLILIYLEVILIILGITGFVLIGGFFYFFIHGAKGKRMNQQIHSATKKKKKKTPADSFYLCLLGQFVYIFGGGRPKVYILGYI